MARWARVVIPDCPHHVVVRGNHQERVFFSDSDRLLYLRLIRLFGIRFEISYLAYCLMTNHVHFVAVPKSPASLARGLGEAQRKYASLINVRENLSGHLWQSRYRSYPMDEAHLFSAIRYIERNPVRAGMVSNPEDYPWSSARAHMRGGGSPDMFLETVAGTTRVDGLSASTRYGGRSQADQRSRAERPPARRR